MMPALTVLRRVARTPERCMRCDYPIEPLQSAYSLMVGEIELITHCSFRCSELDALAKRRLPLRLVYAH